MLPREDFKFLIIFASNIILFILKFGANFAGSSLKFYISILFKNA